MAVPDFSSLPESALITTAELAETLRLSQGRLRNLRCKGRGPRGIKIGKSVRFRMADVQAWLDAQADPAPAAEQSR